MRLPWRLSPFAALAALALGVPASAPAQQRTAPGEIFLTQVGGAARAGSGGPAAAAPTPAGAALREQLFRNPPLDVRGGASRILGFSLPQNGSAVTVDQQGDGNSASIHQSGSGNLAAIVQQGAGNRVVGVQQGSANLMAVGLFGDGNELKVAQRGDDNQYSLAFLGNRLDHSVVQQGSGLRAVQVGVGSLPFGIVQQGRGVEIRIEHFGTAP
jgi:hypothetical protein